jgi:hypothetical protein
MNGRLYDPKLRSFLMPDNFIQQPENTQNYNRYAYVLNNPLMYTDPSGEYGVVAAVIIGAVIAAATYTATHLINGDPISARGLIQSTFMGAVSGVVTFGIGSASESLFSNFFSRAAFQAVAHGTFQGGLSSIQGGSFFSSFAAGALSSIAASAWTGGSSYGVTGAEVYNSGMVGIGAEFGDAGMIAFGTVSGGLGAALTGGNFWEGAAIGLVVSGLNHLGHHIEMGIMEKAFDREVTNAYGVNADKAAPPNDATLSNMRIKLPTLNKLYKRFGQNVKLNAQDKIYTASDGADAHTYVTHSGNFDDPYVMFYRASFSSYRYLAHTMLHEFGHVSSYITHNFLNNFNGNKGSFDAKWDRAIAQDELFAHEFAFKYDGIPYKETYSWQHNYNILH